MTLLLAAGVITGGMITTGVMIGAGGDAIGPRSIGASLGLRNNARAATAPNAKIYSNFILSSQIIEPCRRYAYAIGCAPICYSQL